MSDRITKADLNNRAELLTTAMRDAAIITDRERVVLYGAYGGHAYHVTGVTIADGTSHRTGVAGLLHGCEPARKAWENATAVLNAIRATMDANRDAINVGRGL